MPITHLYTDGSVIRETPGSAPGTWASTTVGAWAYCHVDHTHQRVQGHVDAWPAGQWGTIPTPIVVELAALVFGLEALPEGWAGLVCSDNGDALNALFLGLHLAQIPGWLAERATALRTSGHIRHATPQRTVSKPTLEELERGYDHLGRPASAHHRWCHYACLRAAADVFQLDHGTKQRMRAYNRDEQDHADALTIAAHRRVYSDATSEDWAQESVPNHTASATHVFTYGSSVRFQKHLLGTSWAVVLVDAHGEHIQTRSGTIAIDAWEGLVPPCGEKIAAVVAGLEAVPPGWAGAVYADTIDALYKVFLTKESKLQRRFPPWLAERILDLRSSEHLAGVSYHQLASTYAIDQLGEDALTTGRLVFHNERCRWECRDAGQKLVERWRAERASAGRQHPG